MHILPIVLYFKTRKRYEVIRVHKGRELPLAIDRQHYVQLMVENLPTLRARLGLNQAELANMLGITRQTLSAVESGARELTWGNFISLLYVFTQNEETDPLLETLGIYTPELASLFRVTNISRLKEQNAQKKGGGKE